VFCSYDSNRDKFIDAEDLRKMMKKLGMSDDVAADAGLMIEEVDEDHDGRLNLREVCCGQYLNSGTSLF
jgi:Ca2+-binding EF-hand superfamily protein